MNPSLNPVLSQFIPVRTLTRCVLKQNCNIIVPTTHRRGAYRVLVVKPVGKEDVEDLGVDGRIILKRIFKK